MTAQNLKRLLRKTFFIRLLVHVVKRKKMAASLKF